jgi:PDZ domain-containing secreted protein
LQRSLWRGCQARYNCKSSEQSNHKANQPQIKESNQIILNNSKKNSEQAKLEKRDKPSNLEEDKLPELRKRNKQSSLRDFNENIDSVKNKEKKNIIKKKKQTNQRKNKRVKRVPQEPASTIQTRRLTRMKK